MTFVRPAIMLGHIAVASLTLSGPSWAAVEQSRFEICRWVSAREKGELEKFLRAYPASIADDLDGAPVFMATSAFNLRYEEERWPDVVFSDVKDYQASNPK